MIALIVASVWTPFGTYDGPFLECMYSLPKTKILHPPLNVKRGT